MREYITKFIIILLAAWVSFFAPWMSGYRLSLFSLITGTMLLVRILTHAPSLARLAERDELPFWIFYCAMLTSQLFTRDLTVSWHYFFYFILPVPLVYFFTKVFFQPKYAFTLFKAMVIFAVAACAFGIVEMVTGKNFIYQQLMRNHYFQAWGRCRMFSTHIHPVPLSTYFAAVLFLALGLVAWEKKSGIKRIWLWCAGIIVLGIILTLTRSVLLAVAAGVLLFSFFLHRKKWKMIFCSTLLATTALVVWGSFFSFYLSHSPLARLRLGKIFWRFSFALERCASAAQIMREHPFFGLGLGNFRTFFDRYLPQAARRHDYFHKVPDCMYLSFLTDSGIVGFSGFLIFIYFLAKRIEKGLKSVEPKQDKVLLVSLASGLIAITLAFLTYDGLYWPAPSLLFWGLAGILSSLTGGKEKIS